MPATPSSDCSERLGRVRQPSAIWRAGGSASGSYAPRTSASADAAREAFAFRRRRITPLKFRDLRVVGASGLEPEASCV